MRDNSDEMRYCQRMVPKGTMCLTSFTIHQTWQDEWEMLSKYGSKGNNLFDQFYDWCKLIQRGKPSYVVQGKFSER